MAEVKNKREQVKDCIEKGNMTKVQIAEELNMSAGSVSTQMTYLRWMGMFILIDAETKALSFTDEETYKALAAEKAATSKSKGKTSTRTPAERAVAVAKTIANQTATLAKWETKIVAIEEILAELPDDADANLNMKEAIASVSLLEVKITRNEALAATLPDLAEATAEVDAAAAKVAEAEAAEVDAADESEVVEDEETTDELL